MNNNSDSSDDYYLEDEIEFIEKEVERMERDIENLWDDVFQPYLDSINDCYVLDELRYSGKAKFIGFMASRNPACIKLMAYRDFLYRVQQEEQEQQLSVQNI